MDKEHALQQIKNVIIQEIKSFAKMENDDDDTTKSPISKEEINNFIVTNTKMIDDVALEIFNDYTEDNEVEELLSANNKKKILG